MIIIGLGANLPSADGTPPAHSLCNAAKAMNGCGLLITKASHIWKSAPVPASDQPWYHNAVCTIKTSLSPENLLKTLNNIEEKAGRIRTRRNEARILDLDILAYNNEIIKAETLQIPHPRMHERAFVLYPLRELAPDWVHPASGKTLEEMINALDPAQQIEKTDIEICKNQPMK